MQLNVKSIKHVVANLIKNVYNIILISASS